MKQEHCFVHIAPSHGQDDYDLASKNGIEAPFMIDDEGVSSQVLSSLLEKEFMKMMAHMGWKYL